MAGKKDIHISDNVALVSAPWPLFNRPSIQLGTLKAYLKSRYPDLSITNYHFYLKVAERTGYPVYQKISERTWLAEPVYGALLYPDRKESIEKLFQKRAMREPLIRNTDFNRLIKKVRKISDALISSVDWHRFMLVGFSVSLCQLTATIYFIRKIKKRFPHLKIVVGGTTFSGLAGQHVLQTFPEIDFIVNGEGETPLAGLVHALTNRDCHAVLPEIPGVISRNSLDETDGTAFRQLKDLNRLPPPDYDEYFNMLKMFDPEKRFFPTLPVESSRGCWWRKPDDKSETKGCAFCNLNLQWEGYRRKDPVQVIKEIDELTSKYKILSVAFMDNVLPTKQIQALFKGLTRLNKDFKLFAEIRANFPPDTLRAMKKAGMEEVQVGIEALSTSLLDKMNKGATAIQNLEIMKHCEALGVLNESNLIIYFPGSDPNDVAETLKNLEFAMVYRPLRYVSFWLGLGSPVWKNPKHYNIRQVSNHPNYSVLFPEEISRHIRFIIQSFRGDLTYQRKLWEPVKKKIGQWKKMYADLAGGSPILSYRDGREFMIIRQKRLTGEPITHRLEGKSREIYLFCQTRQSIKDIIHRFQTTLREDQIMPFLRMMVDKKLMFEEDQQYLSLAIPVGPNTLH
jgi:ribosomal peptide maturation radical SAM protein 1